MSIKAQSLSLDNYTDRDSDAAKVIKGFIETIKDECMSDLDNYTDALNRIDEKNKQLHEYRETISGLRNKLTEANDLNAKRMNKQVGHIEKLHNKLALAVEFIEMVEDNRKMPHFHAEYQTRLYCLTDKATELLKQLTGQ